MTHQLGRRELIHTHADRNRQVLRQRPASLSSDPARSSHHSICKYRFSSVHTDMQNLHRAVLANRSKPLPAGFHMDLLLDFLNDFLNLSADPARFEEGVFDHR